MITTRIVSALLTASLAMALPLAQDGTLERSTERGRLERLKAEATTHVEAMASFTQQMVDQIFSFGEVGFQEVETHRYLVDILRENGFTVEEGIAGIPTAFMASWGGDQPNVVRAAHL